MPAVVRIHQSAGQQLFQQVAWVDITDADRLEDSYVRPWLEEDTEE